MNQLYQTFGSGDLKTNANKAFQMAEAGPVVILSRTQPKAVMVNPEMWNATARKMSKLEAIVEAMAVAGQNDEGVTLDDLCKRLGVDPNEMAKGGER